MKKTLRSTTMRSLVLLGSCLALSQFAQAQPFNGTLGFTPGGTFSYTGPDIGDATSVTIPAGNIINSLPPTYGVGPNNFIPGVFLGEFGALSVSPLTLTPGGSETLTFADGVVVVLTGNVFTHLSSTALGLTAMGTLTAPGYTATSAELSGSFNQPASGGAVNGNFTVSAPPPPPQSMPEVGSLAVSLAPIGMLLVSRIFKRK